MIQLRIANDSELKTTPNTTTHLIISCFLEKKHIQTNNW